MNKMARKPLSESEIQDLANNMSDIEYEFEEDGDDSVADPNYTELSDLSSDEENYDGSKKRKIQYESDEEIISLENCNSDSNGNVSSDEAEQLNTNVIWSNCTGKQLLT